MKKVTVSFTMTFLLAAGLILAQGPHGNRGGKPGGRTFAQGPRAAGFADRGFEAVSKYLRLNPEQKEVLFQMLKSRRTAALEVLGAVREERSALRDLLADESPDATRVGEKVLSIHGQLGSIREIQSDFIAQFKDMLNTEQLALYEELVEQTGRNRNLFAFRALRLFENRGFHRRGRGGGPGSGMGWNRF